MTEQADIKARFVFLSKTGKAFEYDGLKKAAGAELGRWIMTPIGTKNCLVVEVEKLRYVAVLDWAPKDSPNGIVALMKPETLRRKNYNQADQKTIA